jgi:hypothetical protein
MASKGLNQAEAEILNRILSRVATHAPPSGTNINSVYNSLTNQAGRDYIEALYRPKPIGALLSDDMILKRQWFLVTLPSTVTAEDAMDLVRRAKASGKLGEYAVEDRKDFFGLSRNQPTRLARFVRERLAPLLEGAAIACTAEFLVARAAIEDSLDDQVFWPAGYIHPDQRHSIEVELVLLADSSKAFSWHPDKGDHLVFRSAALTKAMRSSTKNLPLPKTKFAN